MRVPWQNQGPDYSYKNTDQLGVEDRLPKTNAVEALLSLPSHWCFKSSPPPQTWDMELAVINAAAH